MTTTVSACCGAKLKTVEAFDGTNYYACTKCGFACDPTPTHSPTETEDRLVRDGGICISCGKTMWVPHNQMAGMVHEKCKTKVEPTVEKWREKLYSHQQMKEIVSHSVQEAKAEERRKCLATIMLWRPYFYERKVTKRDKEELKTMFDDLSTLTTKEEE